MAERPCRHRRTTWDERDGTLYCEVCCSWVLRCEDYGHHGRERCVVCGIPNPAQSDGTDQ